MKYVIITLLSALVGCSSGDIQKSVEDDRGYLLSSHYNGDIVVLKSKSEPFVVRDYPIGFSPPMPNPIDESCIYVANEAIFSGTIERNPNKITLSKVKLLRRANPNEIGKITPSFKSSMIC